MSTTFGARIGIDKEITEVAFRSNGMRFTNACAYLLSDDTPVIALDNTPQGIHTIGDIKKAIEVTDPDEEYWRTIKL